MENDIDGILAKLQKSLSDKNREPQIPQEDKKKSDLEFKSLSKEESKYEIDIAADSNLREKILNFFNKELEDKFGNFFSTEDGQKFISQAINMFLEKHEELIENMIKLEISRRLKNIQL